MKSADNLKRLFKDAELSINPDTDERVFEDVLQAQQDTQKNLPAVPESIWRITMKSPITKLATAAIVAVACLIGLSLWRSTESGIALADVLARVEKVKAVKNKWTFKFYGGDPNKPWADDHGTELTSQEYGSKVIFTKTDPNGGEIIDREVYRSIEKKPVIQINRTQKTYIRQVKGGQVQNEQSQSQIGPVEDRLSYLKEILNTKHESMGRSIMDGIEVAGFRTTDPNYKGPPVFRNLKEEPQYDAKMWVDVKTLLPVRIEYLTSDLDRRGTRMFLHQVEYDFQWDISVDPAEFEPPPIPDGYAIQDMFPELANEENAIGGLKQCVELLGNYPERIDFTYLWSESEKSETPAALRVKEELKGLTGLDRDQKKLDALKPMRLLNKFYLGLAGKFYIGMASKDPVYYGRTVTPKDADKVLLRWKVSDNEYRVIFGDLHAETVTPEKLAELEKALPK